MSLKYLPNCIHKLKSFSSTKLPVQQVLESSVCSHPPNSQSYKYWSPVSVPIHKTPSPTSTGVECLCDVSKSLKYLPNCIHKLKSFPSTKLPVQQVLESSVCSHPSNSQSYKYWSPVSVPIHQTPSPTRTGGERLFPSTKLPVLQVLESSVCSHPLNSQSYKYWSRVSL